MFVYEHRQTLRYLKQTNMIANKVASNMYVWCNQCTREEGGVHRGSDGVIPECVCDQWLEVLCVPASVHFHQARAGGGQQHF